MTLNKKIANKDARVHYAVPKQQPPPPPPHTKQCAAFWSRSNNPEHTNQTAAASGPNSAPKTRLTTNPTPVPAATKTTY
ncbi:hypothetical protein GCM10028800_20470 [Nesterenkonia populi]